ncbi:MAG TPA: hypothetical protein VJQ61_02115 [Sinomonas sp.]|nr:hypothetical protein [Sinomonas sp.]
MSSNLPSAGGKVPAMRICSEPSRTASKSSSERQTRSYFILKVVVDVGG